MTTKDKRRRRDSHVKTNRKQSSATDLGSHNKQVASDEGREKLWGWFELSYAAFLTLPRVLMHEMPDDWQSKMADLLNEYDEIFPNMPDIATRVQVTNLSGKLISTPSWLRDYRRPDRETIATFRKEGGKTTK